jgi:hypothetical protein
MDAPANEAADPGKLIDDIRSMSIASADRKRLVDLYLDGLIRAIEPDQRSQYQEHVIVPD